MTKNMNHRTDKRDKHFLRILLRTFEYCHEPLKYKSSTTHVIGKQYLHFRILSILMTDNACEFSARKLSNPRTLGLLLVAACNLWSN